MDTTQLRTLFAGLAGSVVVLALLVALVAAVAVGHCW